MTPQNVCRVVWHRCLLSALAGFAAFGGLAIGVRAADSEAGLPVEPMLRIEAGQHTGRITTIDTDAANTLAVTSSDDTTVRVWSLPEGRLLRVLRLPIDLENIGK